MKKFVCPRCKSENINKVLWMGLPLKICNEPKCWCAWGFWSFLPMILPFDGCFFAYTGSYVKALWYWLWHAGKED